MVDCRQGNVQTKEKADKRMQCSRESVELGFTSVLLLDTQSLGRACSLFVAHPQYSTSLLPVSRFKGYEQQPQELQGGTGCFVLLVCQRAWGLPNLQSTRGFTSTEGVEFSPRDSRFYSSVHPNHRQEEDDTLLTQDFFASLSSFVVTEDVSTLFCMPGGDDHSLTWAARPFLRSLRHVVVLEEPDGEGESLPGLKKELASVMARAAAQLTTTDIPEETEGIVDILPAASESSQKIMDAEYYDDFVTSKLLSRMEDFKDFSYKLFKALPEDKRVAEQAVSSRMFPTAADEEAGGKCLPAPLRQKLHLHLFPASWTDPELATLGNVEKEVDDGKRGKKRKAAEGRLDDEETVKRPRKKSKKSPTIEEIVVEEDKPDQGSP